MTAPNDTSETSASYGFHELSSGCRDCYRLMQVKGLIAVVTRLLSCRLINGTQGIDLQVLCSLSLP